MKQSIEIDEREGRAVFEVFVFRTLSIALIYCILADIDGQTDAMGCRASTVIDSYSIEVVLRVISVVRIVSVEHLR